MKLKKIFATASACVLAALSAVSMTAVVSAEGLPSKAFICGEIGETKVWSADDAATGSTVADVNGDAQYQVEWVVTDSGAEKIEFLAVSIPDLSTKQYANMKVTVDGVYVDDTQISDYKTSATAIDMDFVESGKAGTRIYLHDEWAGTGITDIPAETAIKKSIKVLFTISGTGITGTSNVTDAVNPTDATDATDATTTSETTASSTPGAANTTRSMVLGNSTNIKSSTTGDAGVAGIAVAGLVVTAGAAVLSKVKFGKKKK